MRPLLEAQLLNTESMTTNKYSPNSERSLELLLKQSGISDVQFEKKLQSYMIIMLFNYLKV